MRKLRLSGSRPVQKKKDLLFTHDPETLLEIKLKALKAIRDKEKRCIEYAILYDKWYYSLDLEKRKIEYTNFYLNYMGELIERTDSELITEKSERYLSLLTRPK